MRNTNYIVEKLLNTLDKESEWTYLGKWQKKKSSASRWQKNTYYNTYLVFLPKMQNLYLIMKKPWQTHIEGHCINN